MRMPILNICPEATIPCRHSRYITDTDIEIDPTATLFYSEIYMGGRKYYGEGELFEYDLLSVCTRPTEPTVRFCSVRNWLPTFPESCTGYRNDA